MKSKTRASSHHKSVSNRPSIRSRAAPTAIKATVGCEFDSLKGAIVPTSSEPSSQPLELSIVEPSQTTGESTKRKRARIARGASTLRLPRSQLNGSLKFPSTLQSRYESIETRPFLPCKVLDFDFLRMCNMEHMVREYLSNVGWDEYMNVTRPAYYELVYEFFTTFEFNKKKGLNTETPDVIKFRMMNRWKKCTLSDFNVALGFASRALVTSPEFMDYKCDYLDYFENQTTYCWRTMTNETSLSYDPKSSTDSYLLYPVLRYIHRFLAFSFSGRASSPTVCSKAEFYVLWCMVNNVKLNFAYWIGTQFNSIVQNKSKLRLKSLILGSLITNIAIHLGCFDPDNNDLHVACDVKRLDETCLRKWCVLEKDSPTPVFVAPGPPWREIVAKKKKCVSSALVDEHGPHPSHDDFHALSVRVDDLHSMLDAQQKQLDKIGKMVQDLVTKAP